ncbi:MAG: LysR family transcriptional regulator [Myxococcales bacterium]|nr:LysR family transcriptional regulator [Myxococcales bacterium]
MADLNEMAVFVKVAEEMSITGAARAMGLPKSTVSRRLARLEERLGVRLIHRTTRNLNLTEVGVAFYERCARIIAEAEDAELTVSELQQFPRGHLRITAPSIFAVAFLRPILSEFMTQFSDVTVELMLSSRVVNVIEEGFDLAIRVGRLEDSTLVARKLGPTSVHLYASPDYLEARGLPKRPEDLAEHECLILGSGSPHAEWRLEGAKREQVSVSVQGRLVVNDLLFLRDATIAGMGISLLPTFLCYEPFQEGLLQQVLPTWRPPANAIYAVYPSRRYLSAKVRVFLEFLTERLSPSSAWTLPHEKRPSLRSA